MKIGKVSESVLQRSVLRQLHTDRDPLTPPGENPERRDGGMELVNGAGVGEDCAIFALREGERMVSCVQEAVVARAGDGAECRDREEPVAMEHLILRCANNLAACGATPRAVAVALLLPETAEEPLLRELMSRAQAACRGLSMRIAGGQTRVTAAVTAPYAVVTGYGSAPARDCRTADAAAPGQDIVVSKWIGLEGTAALAGRYREKLLARYPAGLVDRAAGFDRFLSVIPEAAVAVKSGVRAMHDASEGGILAALWELAEAAGVGLTVDLRKLPLRQETVEVCECLGANPYELRSGGCLVMTAGNGSQLADALEVAGIPAAVVGRTTDGSARLLINKEDVRYLERPRQDELYRMAEKGN